MQRAIYGALGDLAILSAGQRVQPVRIGDVVKRTPGRVNGQHGGPIEVDAVAMAHTARR